MTIDTLLRFLTAQENTYPKVINELQNGKKTTHWMWFIFPQIQGLGQSQTAKYYSIKNIKEAHEYLAHPILGARLMECVQAILNVNDKTANDIFGSPDDMKLRSSMTLFDYVKPEETLFKKVLQKYFAGKLDHRTLSILNS